MHNIWFVGDKFLRDIYYSFQAMVNRAKSDKRQRRPFLFEYFNTKGFYYASANYMPNATSRILNKLIEALNENDRLPKYIVFLMDKDVVGDLKTFDFGVTKNLANIVNWLTRQCEIVIRRKQLQIMEKKPGAITEKQPVLIYATMLRQLEQFQHNSKLAAVCSMRNKFNEILNEAIVRQNNKIMHLKSCITLDHFDCMGNLSSKGKSEIWYEIDEIIERFDKGDPKMKLLPWPVHRR